MLEKIKEIFRKIFRVNAKQKLLETSNETTYQKENIRDSMKVEDNSKILFLQKEYEKGKIFETKLSNIQIKKLIKLYENQIKELDYKLLLRKNNI